MLTSAWSITEHAAPPRAAFVDFPLGNTAGPPNDPQTQMSIVRAALDQLHTVSEAGAYCVVDVEWHEPWKPQARALLDHRTERFGTPQYQEPSDFEAAVERHGESAAARAPDHP